MRLWLVMFGVGTLLLQAGFALQACGAAAAKNAASAVLRVAANAAVGTLAFWAVGAALLFGGSNGIFSLDRSLLAAAPVERATVLFFHLALVLIGGAIVSGALLERTRFYATVAATIALTGFVVPMVGHWAWFGWLKGMNFVDFGGGTVVHLTAAVFAAVGVAITGARAGKYGRNADDAGLAGHALPLMSVGVVLLLIGWFPYLLGAVTAHWSAVNSSDDGVFGFAAVNVILAAAGGVCGGLLYSQLRYGKPDFFFTCAGLVGALVAISPGVIAVTNFGAVAIGLMAGVVVPMVAVALDVRARLDDPIGVIAIHGVGGLWGTLAVPLFDDQLYARDRLQLLMAQAAGAAAAIALSAVAAAALFLTLRAAGRLRLSAGDEQDGADLAEHGVEAWPAGKAV